MHPKKYITGVLLALALSSGLAAKPLTKGSSTACPRSADVAAQFDFTPLAQRKRLRIGSYNVENLFHYQGIMQYEPGSGNARVRRSDPTPKPEAKQIGVGQAIVAMHPDVLTVVEVDGEDTLDDFDHDFIGVGYETYLLKGNDERGINVGTYVLPIGFHITRISHKDALWADPTQGYQMVKLYARDAPVTLYRVQEHIDDPNDLPPPVFAELEVHQKSQRDRDGDPRSVLKRGAEAANSARLIVELEKDYGEDLSVFAAGDFNDDVLTAPEFKPYFTVAKMQDALHLAGLSGDATVTHTYHPQGGAAHWSQMDAILMNRAAAKYLVTAQVYRYPDASGRPKPIPQTYGQRNQNPSDHFGLYADIDFAKMWADYLVRYEAWKASRPRFRRAG